MESSVIEGCFYRLHLAITPELERQLRRSPPPNAATVQHHVHVVLERDLELRGWRAPVVMPDPTVAGRFTATAWWGAPTGSASFPFAVEPLDAPLDLPKVAPPAVLDSGLTPEEAWLVQTAIAHETNPRHLDGIASSLEPRCPAAASLVRIKGRLLEGRTRAATLARAAGEARMHPRAKLARPIALRTRDDLADLTVDLGPDVLRTWDRVAPNAGIWRPDVRVRAAIMGADRNDLPFVDLFDACRGATAAARRRDYAAAGGSYAGLLTRRRAELEVYSAARNLPVDLLRDHVRLVAGRLAEGHDAYDAPPDVLAAAMAVVREVGPGLRIVDGVALRTLCPPADRDAYVSPGALQLALSTGKPEWSRIADEGEADRLCEFLSRSDDAAALAAKAQLFRANRANECQRWLQWYCRLMHRSPAINTTSRVASIGAL